MATTDSNVVQDATYKNRATAVIVSNVCSMSLTGLPDGSQDIECSIKQDKAVTKIQSVDKSKAMI